MTKPKNTAYRLSIQFSLDGFSFIIYNEGKLAVEQEKEVKYTAQEKFYDWLKVKLAKEEAFRLNYTKINLLYTPVKYSLIPSYLLEEDKEKELLSLNFPIENTEMIKTEMLNDYAMLSLIPCDLYNLVKDYFPTTINKTTPTLLIEQANATTQWVIGVMVLYAKLHIIIKKNDEIQLSNSFNFQTKDDLLFYMLYTFDNLSIPVADSCIQLLGNRDYLPLLKNELSRYHNDVRIVKSPNGVISKLPLGNLLLLNL